MDVIPTPSEGSEISYCESLHESDSEEILYENVASRVSLQSTHEHQNGNALSVLAPPERDPILNRGESLFSLSPPTSSSDSVFGVMEDQVNRLCEALERMRASVNAPVKNVAVKSTVTIPVFRGDECEDVYEFVRNYKRAAQLNGWDENSLALGFPLYLKGHAGAWYKTLPASDGMSFDNLSAELIRHFGSGASEWRIRHALSQRRQLEKETVADYSYSLRSQCARLNLPRGEWTHYFVQGLLPEIREYVVLQQPDNLEAAENFAKLKESVLASSGKRAAFDPKEVSAQILEELSKAVKPKECAVSAIGQGGPYVNKAEMKQIIREEFQQLMGSATPRSADFNQRSNIEH